MLELIEPKSSPGAVPAGDCSGGDYAVAAEQ
jgi:hypothetical protein